MSFTLTLVADIPENRKLTLELPPSVPAGRARMDITIENAGPAAVNGQTQSVRPVHPTLALEFDAFQKLLPTLLPTMSGQYVAVNDGQIVASGPDADRVIRDAYARCGYQAIFLARVTEVPAPVARSGLRLERTSASHP